MKPQFKSHILALSLITVLALASGCAYHGTLRSGFYMPASSPQKLPLKANLVCGGTMEEAEFSAENVYFSHSVHIKTHPALSQALAETCQSLFDQVTVSRSVRDDCGADIVLFPTVEMREQVLQLTVVAKSATSGEVLQQYQSAGNIVLGIPAGVHVMGGFNIAFCGLLSPAVCPAVTSTLGHKGEKVLEQRFSSCLSQIAEDIRNDRSLVAKARNHPRAGASDL